MKGKDTREIAAYIGLVAALLTLAAVVINIYHPQTSDPPVVKAPESAPQSIGSATTPEEFGWGPTADVVNTDNPPPSVPPAVNTPETAPRPEISGTNPESPNGVQGAKGDQRSAHAGSTRLKPDVENLKNRNFDPARAHAGVPKVTVDCMNGDFTDIKHVLKGSFQECTE